MKTCKNHMLCWTPNTDKVALIAWPDTVQASKHFSMSSLACNDFIRANNTTANFHYLVVEFVVLVLRDGIDPVKLHNILMELAEYREYIPREICDKITKVGEKWEETVPANVSIN